MLAGQYTFSALILLRLSFLDPIANDICILKKKKKEDKCCSKKTKQIIFLLHMFLKIFHETVVLASHRI